MPVDIYGIENSFISFWGKINPSCPSLGPFVRQILALPGKKEVMFVQMKHVN